jgi:hypothetical protein
MNMITSIFERCDGIVDGLRAEFGAVLAERILEAEALDFMWDARVKERYLGQSFGAALDGGFGDEEHSRIVVLSVFDRRWHVGLLLVDGEGCAVDLLWRRAFKGREQAEMSFMQVR